MNLLPFERHRHSPRPGTAVAPRSCRVPIALAITSLGLATLALLAGGAARQVSNPSYVVFGYNDLGMHCMQSDFSQMMILPPYNVLHAQVIRRGSSPEIMTGNDVAVRYALPNNTTSTDKTNFWVYVNALMGANLPPDVGLAGKGLSGTMDFNLSRSDYEAVGIPLTPIDDNGVENPYPLSLITVTTPSGTALAQTQAVVPVSWEMSCNICHHTAGESVATNVLKAHDRLHATDLMNHQPVMCASCHSDNALGTPGTPGVKSLSHAMHGAHAARLTAANITGAQACYTCHPGYRTTCLRDVHSQRGMDCISCHGTMENVANEARTPWLQEPSCASCHQANRPTFQFEQPNTLFRNSKGHMGVQCLTCHGSPHAIAPTSTRVDNLQALRIQGHAGTIGSAQGCTACHFSVPTETFPHRIND